MSQKKSWSDGTGHLVEVTKDDGVSAAVVTIVPRPHRTEIIKACDYTDGLMTMCHLQPIWRTVAGARRYAVSDQGDVRNARRLLVQHLNDEGYRKIRLVFDDGKSREVFVHRLVAIAFLPPPRPEQRYVLHGPDHDRTNCRVDNLRWGTHAENAADKVRNGTAARGATRKLLPKHVRLIRESTLGAARLAKQLRAQGIHLSISHVREVRNYRKWRQIA